MNLEDNVAGFDLSLSSTGVSTKMATFSISSKKVGEERLEEYYKLFCGIIQKYSIKIAILENYAFSSPFQREALAELGGVFKLACFQNGVDLFLIAPTTLKKFITNNGKTKKDTMRLEVYKKWGVEFDTNDEVDAFALRMFGYALVGCSENLFAYEKDTIKRFKQNKQVVEKLTRLKLFKE